MQFYSKKDRQDLYQNLYRLKLGPGAGYLFVRSTIGVFQASFGLEPPRRDSGFSYKNDLELRLLRAPKGFSRTERLWP
jgi:hypothetical protein